MRRPLVIAACGLLLALIVASILREHDWASWLAGAPRHTFGHTPCGIPVHYVLDEIDPRFGFDEPTVTAAIVEATNLWQSTTNALLFVASDHPASMSVNLRFDERQREANIRRSLRSGLDRERRQLVKQEEELIQWNARIERARRDHDHASALLAQRVRDQDAAILAWNSGQDRQSEAHRQELAAESTELRMSLRDLELSGEELNAEIAAFNRRAEEFRQRAADYQSNVSRYNRVAGGGSAVESGRYSYERAHGRRIDVFRAESYDELVWILAHEVGHALGLGHVDEPGAIMHSMLHDGLELRPGKLRPVQLSLADRNALFAICGDRIR